MTRSSRRPGAAEVLALAALFVALGGTALALPGKNKVDKNDIKKGAVKSKTVKDDSLTGVDVAPNSLTGDDVDESSLAVGGGCPQGLTQAGDVCYDGPDRTAGWLGAVQACAAAGLRLPTIGEAMLVVGDLGPGRRGSVARYWTDNEFLFSTGAGPTEVPVASVVANLGSSLDVSEFPQTATGTAYRCVTSPG